MKPPLIVVLFSAAGLSACMGTSIQVRTPAVRPPDLREPAGTQAYVQAPLIANLAVSPNPAIRNRSTTFTGSTSGTQGATIINQYSLEFGDGEAAIARRASSMTISVQHAYAKTGAYVATLTITNNNGNTASVSTPVKVIEN
jgi:PKD repeat protein